MKVPMRLIGDVHGHKELYLRLCQKAEYTIQLGDHGFDYDYLAQLSPKKHKILGGNHDNYDKIGDCPHYLGDFGVHKVAGHCIFFIRGGFSLDWQLRTVGVSWWQNEEMSIRDCRHAIETYEDIRPRFVISHECPMDILGKVIHPREAMVTRTGQMLNSMWAIHKPKMWVFAHYHKSWREQVKGTEFICLDELECLDFKGT